MSYDQRNKMPELNLEIVFFTFLHLRNSLIMFFKVWTFIFLAEPVSSLLELSASVVLQARYSTSFL